MSRKWKHSEDRGPQAAWPWACPSCGFREEDACPGAHACHTEDSWPSEHARAGGPGGSAAVTAPGAGEGTGRAGDTRRQRPPRGPVFLLLTLTPVFWKKSLKSTYGKQLSQRPDIGLPCLLHEIKHSTINGRYLGYVENIAPRFCSGAKWDKSRIHEEFTNRHVPVSGRL